MTDLTNRIEILAENLQDEMRRYRYAAARGTQMEAEQHLNKAERIKHEIVILFRQLPQPELEMQP